MTDLYKAIFDSSPTAIMIADNDGKYVEINPAAEKLLGASRENIIGKKVADFVAPVRQKETEKLWSDFQEKGYQEGYFTISRESGIDRRIRYRAKSNFLPGLHMSVAVDVT